MKQAQDIQLWDDLKKTVQPLETGIVEQELPPRLKVRRASVQPVVYTLDLHQMTLEQAYQSTLKFVDKHFKIGSKKIQIITGKGCTGKGLIRSEFPGWLETKPFKSCIRETRWTNDGGAVDLCLKKSK